MPANRRWLGGAVDSSLSRRTIVRASHDLALQDAARSPLNLRGLQRLCAYASTRRATSLASLRRDVRRLLQPRELRRRVFAASSALAISLVMAKETGRSFRGGTNPFEAEPQRNRVAGLRHLDALARQCLSLAIEQRLGGKRRLVTRAAGAAARVAALALLPFPTVLFFCVVSHEIVQEGPAAEVRLNPPSFFDSIIARIGARFAFENNKRTFSKR